MFKKVRYRGFTCFTLNPHSHPYRKLRSFFEDLMISKLSDTEIPFDDLYWKYDLQPGNVEFLVIKGILQHVKYHSSDLKNNPERAGKIARICLENSKTFKRKSNETFSYGTVIGGHNIEKIMDLVMHNKRFFIKCDSNEFV